MNLYDLINQGVIQNPVDIKAFFIKSIDVAYHNYSAMLSEVRRKADEEVIHDLRVSARRLLAVTDLISRIYPNNNITELKHTVKPLLKSLGPLRDIQVQLLTLVNIRLRFPEMNYYFYHLLELEQEYLIKINLHFKKLIVDDNDGIVFFIMLDLKNNLIKVNSQQIINKIDEDYAKLITIKQNLIKTNYDLLHKMRIIFKKFRYIIDTFGQAAGISKQNLKGLGEFQTMLGEIQDARVLHDSIIKYSLEQDRLPVAAFKPTFGYLNQRKKEAVAKLMENIDMLEKFWKINPHEKIEILTQI